jgi:RNA polymerase sigma-70 factor (ECF subfamily)
VRLALAALPPEQRRVIEAAFFDGLSHSEVAEALELPLGTVKTRIRTGLASLRRQLGGMIGAMA